MRLAFTILLLLLSASVWGQVTVTGGVSVKGSMTVGGVSIPTIATLPQAWGDDHGCPSSTDTYDVVKHIPGDYAAGNGQQAWLDWQADGVNDSWHVITTAGVNAGPLTALAKLVAGVMTTKCIVFDSSTPLPAGRTVCTHGIQDNVATSTDPGVRNPDCNGTGMSYQLGQTLTSIPPGAFTLANGTATNTSAYNDVASLFLIECNTVNCASVSTGSVDANGNGPNHFAIYNAEIRVNTSKTCCFAVDMENAGSTVQSLPSHIHFDRIWMHSDATDAGAGTQSLTDYMRINCGGDCTISNSHASKGIRPGSEGHGIYWADAGQVNVVHNWIEGMSIGIFDGGQSVAVPGGVSGRDIAIRRNRLTYPQPWLGHGTGPSSVCGANINCVRKNCFEQKGALRYLLDGNICENVDNSGGQNGVISDWNNRACTPSACDNYAQTIRDITITNMVYRHGCGGLLFDANSGNPGSSGNSASTPGRNFFVQNTLLYDISLTNFSCGVSTGGTVFLSGTNHDFTVTSVTRNSAGTVSTIILAGGTGENQTGLVAGDPITLSGCTDTSFNAGPYPFVFAASVGGTTITYPNVGTANATTSCTDFNNGAGWPNFVTWDHVTAVADDANYVGENITLLNATWPRNLVYSNSIFTGTGGLGAPGAVDGTNFTSQWYDFTTLLVHHSVFSQRSATTWAATTAYKLGQVVQPTATPNHFYTAVTSGTSGGSQPTFPSGTRACVADGTVTWQENGFKVGTSGGLPLYTEYRTLNTPITPPTTLFFPQTDFTYGAAADATSVGFTGALNAPVSGTNTCTGGTQVETNFALDLSDWHGYALHSSSAFKGLAADGTDPGVNTSAIDNAQTRTLYVCGSPCGTGPKPD